jgi:hypothetical protein
MPVPILPTIGPDLTQWGRQLNGYLQRNLGKLYFKTSDDNPSENGVILWDNVNEWPVVSYDNEFRQLVMEGGHVTLVAASSITAASANTAYSITYDAPASKYKIDRDGTNPERIVFEEKGEYLLNFTAEIRSSSSSDVTFYFWPAKNGTDLTGSTMVTTLHNNNANLVISRSALIEFVKDDYLEAKWAVSSTNGTLNSTAATAFSPASPASSLTITRIHA